jgi:outer membrane lipoprotein-sorting protein
MDVKINKLSCIAFIFFILLLTEGSVANLQHENPLSDNEAGQILEQITQKLGTVKNIDAEFTQDRHLSILIDPLASEGRCIFATPDQLRWEVFKPYRSILIYNQNNIGKFDFQDGKLRKLNLGTEDLMREILKQIISWMQGNFEDAKKVYDLKLFNSGNVRLVLVPKSAELQKNIRSIELQFTENLTVIRSVKIVETETDFIDIQFHNVKQNIEINPGIFNTEKPEIITQPSK